MNNAGRINNDIRQFVLKQFPLARKHSSLEDCSRLFDSGIIDSLGVMELIMFIEEAFQITVSDEDLLPENFETIASMSAFIQAKSKAQVSVG